MQERNREILKKAIGELPEYQPSWEGLWEGIAKRLPVVKENLSKKTLPEFTAPDYVWDRIEKKLAEGEKEKTQLVGKLPSFKAPEGIWDKTEQGLERKTKTRYLSIQKLLRIAAVFLVLLSIDYGISKLPFSNSSQQVEKSNKSTGIETLITPALCVNNPQVCRQPVYIELNNQLEDIKTELTGMEQLLEENNDPQLLKYYYRLENQQVEIEKRLVKLIMES